MGHSPSQPAPCQLNLAHGRERTDCILASAGGEEYLWYKVPRKVDVAIIRGTTADVDGNVTFEKEAMLADCLNQVGAQHGPQESRSQPLQETRAQPSLTAEVLLSGHAP